MSDQKYLMSFLGTGNYSSHTYTFDGEKASGTPYIQQALVELQGIGHLHLFCTPEATEKHFEILKNRITTQFPQIEIQRHDIVATADSKHLWGVFSALQKCFDSISEGSEVHLDITHGFRALPFFAAAFVAYIKQTHPNRDALRHIWYGAGPEGNAEGQRLPIWDLGPFLELMQWSTALKEFLDSGKAEKLGEIESVQENSRNIGVAHSQGNMEQRELHRNLKVLISSLKNFSEAYLANRSLDLLQGDSLSAKVLSAIEDCRSSVDEYFPPLGPVLQQVQSMLEGMQTSDLRGEEGFEAWLKLATEQARMGRYTDSMATTSEGIRNYYLEGDLLDLKARDKVWSRVRNFELTTIDMTTTAWLSEPIPECPKLDSINSLRNDLAHAGYRNNPISAGKATGKVRAALNHLRTAGLPHIEPKPPSVFVNISNHPQASWSEAQKAAALSYADRIADIPFPDIRPQDDAHHIRLKVGMVTNKLPQGVTHAMVQGEFTATFAIVSDLKAKKITCFAATTVRNVSEDENGAKVSKFEFCGFREYGGLY